MGTVAKRTDTDLGRLWQVLVLPIVFCYLEIVVRAATVGDVFHISLLYTCLFSLAYGGVLGLLTTAFRKPLVNRILTASVLGVAAVVYLIEYFVFYQFKVFYDLTTMVGGATNAVDGYLKDVALMIFSVRGFSTILLCFAPLVAYLLFSGRRFPIIRATSDRWIRGIQGTSAVFLYALAMVLVLANPLYKSMYTSEYNYQMAVKNFGLMTAMRLNIKDLWFQNDVTFETVTQTTTAPTVSTTAPTETAETTVPTVVYEDNVLPLDFAALQEGASKTHAQLDAYVSTLAPSKKNEYTGLFKNKNLILITAEAFCAEVIDEELTPTLYRLAHKGIRFTDFYQPASAGTTGGEYQNLFGMLPTAGGMSVKRTADQSNALTIGHQLNRLGYVGYAFHNNDYTYYDRHVTHNNLGYSEGFMGYGNGMEQYVQRLWPQSDREMFEGTLPLYVDRQPFQVYYMTVSGHSGYSVSGNAMTRKHWDEVQHLPYSDTVKGYIAANLELESALSFLVSELEARGIADDTVICLAPDHFPYGLDSDSGLGDMPYLSELYGYEVDNYFERDHSAWLLWSGCLESMDPIVVDSPTFSLDILPTLSNLFGTDFDSRLMVGRDVLSDAPALVFNSNYDWKTDLGTYYASRGVFEPAEGAVIPDGYVDSIKTIVRNKQQYCESVLDSDYYRHVLGE